MRVGGERPGYLLPSLTLSSLAGLFAVAVPCYRGQSSYVKSPVAWLERLLGSDNSLHLHASLDPGENVVASYFMFQLSLFVPLTFVKGPFMKFF